MRSSTTDRSFECLESRQMMSADLSASIVSPTSGASWSTGVEITTMISVTNSGTDRLRDVGLSVYASTDGTFDSSDVLLGTRSLSTVNGGETETEDVQFTISSGLAAGTYTIFAVVDPSNDFAETDETNNTSAGVSVSLSSSGGGGGGGGGGGSGVDAAISIATAAGTTMTLGREQRVLVNATNAGSVRIEPRVGVSLYASADGTFDASTDTLLGTRTVTLHDPGLTEVEDIEFVLPTTLGAGSFTLFAVIDGANQITETNESNNTSEGVAVTFAAAGGGGGGGGTGSDLTVSVTSPGAGGTMVLGREQRVLVLASNVGSTDTGVRPVVSVYASTDSTLDTSADTLLGSRSLSLMSAGETELEDVEFILPSSLGAGSFFLFAVIDSSGIVTESNEDNNSSDAVAVTFSASAPSGQGSPDLSVHAELEPGDDTLRTGTRENVFVTVSNSGSGHARRSSVRLYASSDDTFDPSEDRLLTSAQVAALRAGQSASQQISFVVPASMAAGSYSIYAVVDDNSQNSESDESNNRSDAVAGTVDVGSFDLAGSVTSLRLSSSVIAGAKAKGSAKLSYSNLGVDNFAKGAKMSIQAYMRPAGATDDSQDVAVGREKVETLLGKNGGRSKTVEVGIELPANLSAGSYNLVFKLDSRSEITELNEDNNEIVADGTFVVAAPFVDMSVSGATSTFASSASVGGTAKGTITLSNLGNIQGKGSVTISFSLRATDGSEVSLSTPALRRVELKAGRPIVVSKFNLSIPAGTSAGEYTIVASASVSSGFTDSVTTNNSFDIGTLAVG